MLSTCKWKWFGHPPSGRALRYNLLRKAKGFPLQSLMQKEAVFVPHDFNNPPIPRTARLVLLKKQHPVVLPPFFSVILFVWFLPTHTAHCFLLLSKLFSEVKAKIKELCHAKKPNKKTVTPTTTTVPLCQKKNVGSYINIMWHYVFASHCLLLSLMQASNRTGSHIIRHYVK